MCNAYLDKAESHLLNHPISHNSSILFIHWSHLYGFFPLFIFKCVFKWLQVELVAFVHGQS